MKLFIYATICMFIISGCEGSNYIALYEDRLLFENDSAPLPEREQVANFIEEMLELDILQNFVAEDERQQNLAEDIVFLRDIVFNNHGLFRTLQLNYFGERGIHLDRVFEIGNMFDDVIYEFLRQLPYLSDLEVKLHIAKALSVFEDNHTRFTDFDSLLNEQVFLVSFRWLGNGYYLVNAGEEYQSQLHKSLRYVNGICINELFYISTNVFGVENIYDARQRFSGVLGLPIFFEAIGIEGDIVYTFADGSSMAPARYDRNKAQEIMATGVKYQEPPMFLVDGGGALWSELTYNDILYIRVGSFYHGQRWLTLFFNVREQLQDHTSNAVIIDVRNNGGGHADLAHFKEMAELILDTIEPNRAFYFMNEGSQSASLYWAIELENRGFITVGMPAGQGLHMFGRAGRYTLPYLDMQFGIPPVYAGMTSRVSREGAVQDNAFVPMIRIEHTIDDWINGIDPLYKYVVSLGAQ